MNKMRAKTAIKVRWGGVQLLVVNSKNHKDSIFILFYFCENSFEMSAQEGGMGLK